MAGTRAEEALKAMGLPAKKEALAHIRKATKLKLVSMDAMLAPDVQMLDGWLRLIFGIAGFDPADHPGMPVRCPHCGELNFQDESDPTSAPLYCRDCRGSLDGTVEAFAPRPLDEKSGLA